METGRGEGRGGEGRGGEGMGSVEKAKCPYHRYMLAFAVMTIRYWLLHLRILAALGKAIAGRIRRPQRENTFTVWSSQLTAICCLEFNKKINLIQIQIQIQIDADSWKPYQSGFLHCVKSCMCCRIGKQQYSTYKCLNAQVMDAWEYVVKAHYVSITSAIYPADAIRILGIQMICIILDLRSHVASPYMSPNCPVLD